MIKFSAGQMTISNPDLRHGGRWDLRVDYNHCEHKTIELRDSLQDLEYIVKRALQAEQDT